MSFRRKKLKIPEYRVLGKASSELEARQVAFNNFFWLSIRCVNVVENRGSWEFRTPVGNYFVEKVKA